MQTMKRAEGLIEEAKAHVSTLRDDEQAQYNALEGTISDLVAQQASRTRASLAHRASDLAGGAHSRCLPRTTSC